MTEHSVDELLEERIEGRIESVTWYKERGAAKYALVASHNENATVSLSTVLLDTEDDTLRVLGDNSMWLPEEPAVLEAATRQLARSTSRGADALEDDADPMRDSLLDFGADEIGRHSIDDEYEPATDDGDGDWKAEGGRQERWTVHERLEESPLENADRFIRLAFTGKAPWEGEPQRVMYPPEEVGANYGVEVDEDDDLVIVDVDEPEAPTDEMPETLRSESPHDGEHRFYHVPGWQEHFQERFGVDNPHPSWGEIRSQDGYVVGPGCILTDCKHGCCTEDEPGRYELDDGPIATVDPETLGDLIEPYRGGS